MPSQTFSIADGNCAIQPFVVPGRESALVAPADAYVATSNLIATCVGGILSKGGQVRRFGEWTDLQSEKHSLNSSQS